MVQFILYPPLHLHSLFYNWSLMKIIGRSFEKMILNISLELKTI